MRSPLMLVALLTLGACATSGGSGENYLDETSRLAADCRARGGILEETGRQSAHASTDHVCKLTSQPSSRVGG